MPLYLRSCQYFHYKLFIYRDQAKTSLHEVTRASEKPTPLVEKAVLLLFFFYEVLQIFKPMENLIRVNGETSRGDNIKHLMCNFEF